METVILAHPLRRDPLLDAARNGSYCRRGLFQFTERGKLGLDHRVWQILPIIAVLYPIQVWDVGRKYRCYFVCEWSGV
jgi:hypothetical protein